MIDKKAIKRYHARVDRRLADRGIRFDGNRWEENKHPRDKDGKFTSGSGSSDGNEEKKSSSVGTLSAKATPVKINKVEDSNKFADGIKKAKQSLKPSEGPWRVTAYDSGEDFDSEHPGAQKHMTDGGSTIAVTPDGDIVGVCHFDGDPVRGKQLIQFAVENGGKKLDAYQGLFGFYTKCGFEPVSWCEWNEEYAPDDWRKGIDDAEHIIFYKYTGKQSSYKSITEFFDNVPASVDYDAAKEARNKEV